MTAHFAPDTVVSTPVALRQRRGVRANLTGAAAEERVAQSYARRGLRIVQRRWRGAGAEIDLISREGETVVFTEVKAAKTHDAAIARLGVAQMKRIYRAAEAYLEHEPKGQLTDVRFDVALFDQRGEVRIIENAFGHF